MRDGGVRAAYRVPDAVQREAISAFTRVFDALWRNGALLIRDRSSGGFNVQSVKRSRISLRSPGTQADPQPLRSPGISPDSRPFGIGTDAGVPAKRRRMVPISCSFAIGLA
jgi:hypothetical protein